MSAGLCELCHRDVPQRTRHHLIPRTRHKSRSAQKRWSREEMTTRVAWLCPPCHKQIHAVLNEKELERDHHTLEQLAAHPKIATFLEWLRTKPADARVVVHRPRRHKH